MKSRVFLAVLMAAAVGCGGEEREHSGVASAQAAAEATGERRADSTHWKAVDQAMGRPGKLQPDGVQKYSMPRSDLKVSARGVAVKPALALGSWVAYQSAGGKTLAMGDLVLTEKEIGPVMSKLEQMGVKATALHNHLLEESPSIMYLHIHGEGDPVKIAEAVRTALALTRTPAAASSAPPTPLRLDTAAIAGALSYSGQANGGVYQVNVPRADPVRVHGVVIPHSMGLATVINFQPTGANKAATTGDFVMTADEVGPVLEALTAAGIGINSLHNHMVDEEPRLFFVHFWGNDDPVKLARGLRTALDRMDVGRPRS
jgi:hypothetical protein